MADNLNRFMNGYGDAEPFTGEPGTPAPVHRVDSGKVDPHLTRYVGTEAARELRALYADMQAMIVTLNTVFISEYGKGCFTNSEIDANGTRLNDILGLSE